MGFVFRKDLEGKKKLGLLFAIVPGILLVVVAVLVQIKSPFERLDENQNRMRDPAGPVDLKDLGGAATRFSDLPEEQRQKSEIEQSLRSAEKAAKQPAPQTARQASDALTQALAAPVTPARDEMNPLGEEEGLSPEAFDAARRSSRDLPDAGSGRIGAGSAGPKEGGNNTATVVYRAAKLQSPQPTGDEAVIRIAQPLKQNKPAKGLLLPRGHRFRVYILSTVDTLAPGLVELGVAENVRFGGKVVLPFGTRLFGTVGGSARDRVQIAVTSVLHPDGSEEGISAHLIGADDIAGIPATYIPRPALVEMAPYVNSFLQAYAASRLARTVTSAVTVGGMTESTREDPAQIAVQEAARMAVDYARKQEQELMERYKPYLIIPPATEATVQLLARFEPSSSKPRQAADTPLAQTVQAAADAAKATTNEMR